MQASQLSRIASIVAFVVAGILILVGLVGPIVVLPVAIVPLAAGIGILRKRVWSAYGFATFYFAQLVLVPVIFFRPGYSTGQTIQLVFSACLSVIFGVFFMAAGRSLAASGAPRGMASPWIAAAALTVVPFFFLQTYEIPGSSMEDTLLPGDRILALAFPVQPPRRGKMALFLSPQDRGLVLIKRVIAVPGDHIRISRKVVILNGTPLDERYAVHRAGASDFYPDDFPNDSELPGCAEGHEVLSQHAVNGEIVVPAGAYFMLGDNRENSLDSRCWGFVYSSDLKGRPLMIYDSVEKTEEQESDPSRNWLGHRRWARLFKVF